MAAKIFRINYKSDFILTLNSDAGWMTPFCIKFWTGAPSQAFFVGWDGETYTHCAYDPSEPTKLLVQFDDHHLPIGDLKFQIAYHFTVADFPNDTEDEVINPASITTEIDGEEYQVMLDFTGETAPEIEFSLPAYANEAQRIANEQQRIANEQTRIENEQTRIQHEETREANESQRIRQEQGRVDAEEARTRQYAQDHQTAVNDHTRANDDHQRADEDHSRAESDHSTASDDHTTATNDHTRAGQDHQQATNDHTRAESDHSRASEDHQTATADHTRAGEDHQESVTQSAYAKEQGDYAKEQGDTALADHVRAEADHGIAVDDHTQAGNDHTRAESDHSTAAADHTTAGNDHTRAESDHGIAADDHTQAAADHTTAAADHTTAGNDHTRAESDHTRAESDHDAVELYVDSLGVFDLSKHNAVGGVLATYADLGAALTALNALDSKYKYGGMSFKFVLSSDHKYVQYLYHGTSTAVTDFTNIENWEKTNLEGEVLNLEKETLGTIYINSWFQGNINGTTGKYRSNNIRVTNSLPIPTNVRVICTGDVLLHTYNKYKSTANPVDGGTPNVDFVSIDLPSSGSRTDVTIEADAIYTDLYLTFKRVSDDTQPLTPEEVAANVNIVYLDADNVKIKNSIIELSGRVTATETVLNNKKNTPIQDSTDLITSGGVEATLFHHYGTKDLVTTTSGQQSIILRGFDYGRYVAARIVSNTADLGSANIELSIRQGNTNKTFKLTSDWIICKADEGTEFNRVYIYSKGSLTTGGTIKVEIIFKDAFDAIIRESSPELLSNLPITSGGVFPYAQSAFKHKPGKNLCNPKDPAFKIGVFLSSGVEANNAAMGTTGYIPVSQNGLILNKNAYSNSWGHAIYDENYQYLRTVKSNTYTYVSGDAYVRFVFPSADKDEIQVEEGTTVTAFEEYNPVYGQIEVAKNEVKEWADKRFSKIPVSPNDISFIHLYNLFNKDTGQNYVDGETTVDIDDNIWGCYLYNNVLRPNASLSVTAYLPVNGEKFFAHKLNGTIIKWICYYKEDKTYLSTETVSGDTAVFTPPTNAKYARVTFYTSDKNDFMVTHDLTPLVYVPYGKYIVDDIFLESGEENIPSEIVLPRNTYVIDGEQNSLYHSAYMDVYNPMVAYVDGASGNWENLERCFRIEANKSAGNLSFKLRDRKTHGELQSITATVKKGLKTNTANAIKINVIGDSFCYGGHYLKQMSDMCDNAQFIGMRDNQYYSGIKCEGRGGWKLSAYFNPKSPDIALNHMQPFSPFMHAQGYNYYGVMEFWASIVNNTSQYAYGTNGFTDYVSWFDTNGRKANPVENDLVYNQTAGKFEYYNGSAWVQLDTEPEFEFNYAEYIRIWQIDTPNFVVFELGTNDFYNNTITFANWSAMMDEAIASIQDYATAESATIKILICTAWTITGLPNDLNSNNVIKRNFWLWTKRKELIAYYDTQAMENNDVYVVDTGIVVDDKYGFLLQEKKPFEYYEGSHREIYDQNGVHPDIAGYKQFGNCIAGAVQYLRT